MVAAVVACVCVATVQFSARTPLLTAVSGLLFVISLWPFYFPVLYRIDEHGVRVDYRVWRRRHAWSRFAAYVVLDGAIALTPFRSPSALERFRLLMLPCPDNRDEVIAALPERLLRRGAGVPEVPA